MVATTYPSRIDAWLILVTAGSCALLLAISFVTYPHAPGAALVNLAVLGVMVLIAVLFAYPCEYTLTDSELVIRSGIIRQRIAYRDITTVEPSRSLWSAPALSLRRVKVSFAGRFQLVSPREREKFIDELTKRVAAARS